MRTGTKRCQTQALLGPIYFPKRPARHKPVLPFSPETEDRRHYMSFLRALSCGKMKIKLKTGASGAVEVREV